ncbi:hypothetical protein Tco_0915363 [Tanacetum coccineum]
MSSYNHFGCSWCGGPFNGGNCPGCSSVGSGNEFVYDPNPYSYNETPNFFNQPPQHQYETYSCELCGDSPHYGFDCQTRTPLVYEQDPCSNQNFSNDQSPYHSTSLPQQFYCCEYCGGPHYSSDCQTRNQLVYEPNPDNSYDFSYLDPPPQDTNRILEELPRPLKPNPPVGEPEGSDDYTKVPFNDEQILRQHSTAHIIPPAYIPSLPFLATMEPTDTRLIGDEVISTIPVRVIDEFIKFSVDDLVPIPKEFEVTSDSNSECDMPTPLPTTSVREEDFDINSHLGEQVVDFLMENLDVAGLPRHLVKRLFNFTSSDDESLSEEDVPKETFKIYSNPLFEFDDDFTSSDVNPLFNEVLEDVESEDSFDSKLAEPTLLISPLSDANKDECFYPGGDEIDAFLDLDISTEIENDFHDSEGDIIFLEKLLINNTFPNLPSEDSLRS